jgi:two-component system, OmpR family, catabolic regulation response regulator CreB
MSRGRILLVEDEPAIADAITYALATEGFEPVWVTTCAAALAAAATPPALAVLDVGLPDGNGFDLFRALIQRQPDLPAIFLTARATEIDRVVGLELGADDYVAKPFSPRELVARIRTVLRRTQRGAVVTPAAEIAPAPTPAPPVPGAAGPGRLAVDDERKQIRYDDRLLELSRIEYRLLKLLIDRPGRVFSRDELMSRAWDDPGSSYDRTVDTHVKSLRAKLRSIDPDSDPIQTHRGMGYSLREGG